MSVRSDVVKETLVETVCQRVTVRLGETLPAAVLTALGDAPDVGRMGYLVRVVESELFQPARSPMPGLADMLRGRMNDRASWPQAAAAVARELASREPLERPQPGDPDAVTWRVPGPGGHVRHYVAVRLTGEGRELKREFVFGFLIRCCEEALSPR
jgi:hypothetical protein